MATPPVFVSGAILTAAQMNAAGMWLISTKTAATSGLVTFHSTLSSDYDNYLIKYTTTANTTSQDVNLYTTNGSTRYAGTAVSSGGYRNDYPSASGLNANVILNVAGMAVGRLDSTGPFGSANIQLMNPFKVAYTTFQSEYIDGRFAGQTIGRLAATTSFDGFEIQFTASWAGQVSLYGIVD
jgi:hypothetical protein